MKPSDVGRALTDLIALDRPVCFLWGPPGVGKSTIINDVAKEAGFTRILDWRAVQMDPTDVKGFPAIKDGKTVWCPPEELPGDDEKCVVFLDELAQAAPLVQNSFMSLVLDRRLGEYRLPDECRVVAASNRLEDRAGTHKMGSALSSRFLHLDMEVSNEDWLAWAIQSEIASEVRAFMQFRPALLHSFDPKLNPRSFPCPRSWHFVSNVVGVTRSELLQPVVAGLVGEAAAVEFIAFLQDYRSLPDLELVITNPDKVTIPREPSVLYAMCGALSERAKGADAAKLNKIARFANRLIGEMSVLLMKDCTALNPQMGDFNRVPEARIHLQKHMAAYTSR